MDKGLILTKTDIILDEALVVEITCNEWSNAVKLQRRNSHAIDMQRGGVFLKLD